MTIYNNIAERNGAQSVKRQNSLIFNSSETFLLRLETRCEMLFQWQYSSRRRTSYLILQMFLERKSYELLKPSWKVLPFAASPNGCFSKSPTTSSWISVLISSFMSDSGSTSENLKKWKSKQLKEFLNPCGESDNLDFTKNGWAKRSFSSKSLMFRFLTPSWVSLRSIIFSDIQVDNVLFTFPARVKLEKTYLLMCFSMLNINISPLVFFFFVHFSITWQITNWRKNWIGCKLELAKYRILENLQIILKKCSNSNTSLFSATNSIN